MIFLLHLFLNKSARNFVSVFIDHEIAHMNRKVDVHRYKNFFASDQPRRRYVRAFLSATALLS